MAQLGEAINAMLQQLAASSSRSDDDHHCTKEMHPACHVQERFTLELKFVDLVRIFMHREHFSDELGEKIIDIIAKHINDNADKIAALQKEIAALNDVLGPVTHKESVTGQAAE